ncbi:hypothetical protein TEA_013326 [Camellia sinensis var. sinensis]|uniref:RING-type domain-containing protein n=2 Tax=Camellia sinensis TaxID=4442 RepID=A0A4S4EUU8_CAMSN|nr:hypothetical protein TEA_013326 [Camellia sinensis var. sinensis]
MYRSAGLAPLRHHHHHLHPQRCQEAWARLLTPLTLWICVSVTLRYGYYGNCQMVLGPSSSRLFEASSVFVKQVEVRDDDKKGVFLYGYSEKPELSLEKNWSASNYVIVASYSRKGYSLWLNKGSTIQMRWEAQASSLGQLEVSLIKVNSSIGDRKHETLIPTSSSSSDAHALLEPTHGREVKYFIEEDDKYYIGIVNTNPRSVIMKMNLNVSSKMYDTTKSESMCSTINGSCQLNLVFPNTQFVTVTTPNNGDLGEWHVELSFVARVVTYIAILGFVVTVIFLILKYLGVCDGETHEVAGVREVTEAVPLMPEKPFRLPYGTEPRNCFFVPCGHCATCYNCAQRIMDGDSKVCPICRRLIHKDHGWRFQGVSNMSEAHSQKECLFSFNIGINPWRPHTISSYNKPFTSLQETPPPDLGQHLQPTWPASVPPIWFSPCPPCILPLCCKGMLHQKQYCFRKLSKAACQPIPWLQLHQPYMGLLWQHWRNSRRIASLEILSTYRIQMSITIRIHEVRSLLSRLYKGSQTQDGEFYMVDMKSAFFELTLNVMMRMIAGELAEKIQKTPTKPFPLPSHNKPFTSLQETPPPDLGQHLQPTWSASVPPIWFSPCPPCILPLCCKGMLHQKQYCFRKLSKAACQPIPWLQLHQPYMGLLWQHWRNSRRIASLEILSTYRIQMSITIRIHEVRSLLSRLYKGSQTQDGEFYMVDMKSAFFELTLNVMMRMIAGKRYYGDTVDELVETRKFKEMVSETFELSGATNIGDFVPVLKWVGHNGIEKRLKGLQQKKDGFMQDLIEENRRMMSDSASEWRSKTMIDVLLSLQQNEPQYYKDEITRGLMLTMLSAGTDTSAGTMKWALSLLPNNPEALKKAYAEIHIHIEQD